MSSNRITISTITLEQIDSVWRLGCAEGVHGNPDLMHIATVAANRMGDFTADEQHEAKGRCAEILNARAGEKG